MADTSKIAWTDSTFNPWIGCAKVSAACKHCYAESDTFARRSRANGLELWGVDAARHVTSDGYWRAPLRWNLDAEKAGVRRRVFCASLSDVFEDRKDLAPTRARLWALIAATPHLDWLVLTKRPERADDLASYAALHAWDQHAVHVPAWPPNVWLGTTVEDQASAEERIPHLLSVPAKLRFLSMEPLLAPVDIWAFLKGSIRDKSLAALGSPPMPGVDWVIVGGESGPHARPFDLAWARKLVRQCRAAGVAPFVKQLGARASDPENGLVGAKLVVNPDAADIISRRLVDPKGGDMSEWPADLQIREFPASSDHQNKGEIT